MGWQSMEFKTVVGIVVNVAVVSKRNVVMWLGMAH